MKEKDDKHAMKFLISSSYFKADGNLDWNNIVKKAIVLIAFFYLFSFLLLFAFFTSSNAVYCIMGHPKFRVLGDLSLRSLCRYVHCSSYS